MRHQDESKPVYRILTEKIEEIDNQYYVTFSYKSSAEKFPVVYTDVLDSMSAATEKMLEFKSEYYKLLQTIMSDDEVVVKKNNGKNIWSQIIDFSVTNRFWWLGLIMTTLFVFLGVLGFLAFKNAEEEDKFAYSSGVWKGMFIVSILMAAK